MSELREGITLWAAEDEDWDRIVIFSDSAWAQEWQRQIDSEARDRLEAIDFDDLTIEERVDWMAWRFKLEHRAHERDSLRHLRSQEDAILPELPALLDLLDSRIRREIPEPESTAKLLHHLAKTVLRFPNAEPAAAESRLNKRLEKYQKQLETYQKTFHHYDPMFTWWTQQPMKDLHVSLTKWCTQLDERSVVSQKIAGEPVGREALEQALRSEMIPYTIEELIKIGERELAWCNQELIECAQKLNLKTPAEAIEHVKSLHEAPGGQVQFCLDLAEEASDYLEALDLLTLDKSARRTWQFEMMPPEKQRVNPFFLGGPKIIISFPTDEMDHDFKQMSLRGNNRHFSRATVHHELIPGHHLQYWAMNRYAQHRNGFYTPFWIEGWALYWEFLFYQDGFVQTTEDRIGFLFWRRHRAARIIFSLKFHLGEMTTQECVEMLVDQVNHERSTAEGEVRRSFGGDYPPLYQLAYMIGALQMWRLRQEVVDEGKMAAKEFHDAYLRSGPMPFEMLRALLNQTRLEKDFQPSWRFDD